MAATYQVITEAEMDEYLIQDLGFNPMANFSVHGVRVKEKVYAKRIDQWGLQLSIRVYSSIQHGKGRKVGGDAIRCEVVWRAIRLNEEKTEEVAHIVTIGRSVRVHRTQGWKTNLKKRIDKWEEMLGPPCPVCQAPTVLRKGQFGEFYGCSTYKFDGCRGKISVRKDS